MSGSGAEPVGDAGAMSRRALLTLSTALGLGGLYGLYANLITGLIDPPSLQDTGRGDVAVPPPRNSVQMAERFLPAAPWAANAKYQMRTKEAFVYFEEWKRVDEHEAVRFWPFAIVWMHNENALREGPITIVSDSAFVKFERKFEITNDPGRVVAAALEGEAIVRGPNGMAIDGRNFTYSESLKRIWSDEPLTFAYGRNSGDAVGTQVELTLAEKPGDSSLAISGMRTVRLKSNVTMNLVSEPGDVSPIDGKPSKEPTRARVTSDGPFEYDVDSLVATYQRNVRVATPSRERTATTAEQLDTLAADALAITFEPNPEAAPTQPAPAPEVPTDGSGQFQSFETDLAFRKLHAEGAPVRLHSEERDVTALMTTLDYDGTTRAVDMRDASQVRVLNAGSELRSPEIRLVHADQGGDLESVVCTGAGRMHHVDPKTGKRDLEAAWQQRMEMHPPDEQGHEMLDLEEGAIVRHTLERAEMRAEFIRMWFRRNPDAPPVTDAEDSPANGFEPRRMLALDAVAMTTPKLTANTQRLEVWLDGDDEEPPAELATALAIDSERNPRGGGVRRPTGRMAPVVEATRTGPSAPSSLLTPPPEGTRGPHGQAFLSADDPGASGTAPIVVGGAGTALRPGGDGPLVVDADLVRVRAEPRSTAKDRRELEVREIWTFGNVHVRQVHAGGKPPLDVTGDRMHVVNRGPDRELIHVYAAPRRSGVEHLPAHVRDRGLHVEGDAIHMDREANRAWVDGPGLLQLPIDRTLDGRKVEQPRPLDVQWTESMEFDGRLATFLGSVRTVVDGNRMRCAEMHVTMSKRVEFSENPAGTETKDREQRPDVAAIHCLDGVLFDGYEYEGSTLTGIRRGRCWEFTLDRRTGDTLAKGPGWVTMWRRGAGRRAAVQPSGIVRANGSVAPNRSEWEYTRIDFEGDNRGNIESRTSRFAGQVEITYGPVAKPLDVFDADALPKNGGWMRSDALEVKQFEKDDPRPAYFTAFADGNVYLRGREFYARADEVTFDELKGRYTLRSKGDRSATIWRERPGGEGYEPQDAKRMEFIPSRNVLRLDRTGGIDGSG